MGVIVGENEAIMETVKVINKLSDEKKRKIEMMSTPIYTNYYYEKRRRSERIDNDNSSGSCDNSSGSCGGD